MSYSLIASLRARLARTTVVSREKLDAANCSRDEIRRLIWIILS